MNCDMSQRAKNDSATWVKECDESDKGMWIRMLNVNVMNVTIMHTMLHVPRSTITCLGDAKHFWNCAMCCDCRITYIILQNKNSPFSVVCVNCVFIYFGRVFVVVVVHYAIRWNHKLHFIIYAFCVCFVFYFRYSVAVGGLYPLDTVHYIHWPASFFLHPFSLHFISFTLARSLSACTYIW